MEKRLYKSRNDKMLFGVCAGVAEYMDVDPTLVRLAMALLVLFGGSGVLIYIIAAIVMPEAPAQSASGTKSKEKEVVVEAEEVDEDE